MRARTIALGAIAVALAVCAIIACSFGQGAYTGPDPLTPEEASMGDADDGAAASEGSGEGMTPVGGDGGSSANDGFSGEASSGSDVSSGDGSSSDGSPIDAPPSDAPTDTPSDVPSDTPSDVPSDSPRG
jgi:hypothetical protein